MDERQNDLTLDELQPQESPEVPESYTVPVEEADYAPESYTAPVEEADSIPESYTAPVEEDNYIPESYTAPVAVAAEEAPVSKAPAKPKKKLNKKLIIGGIAAALVIALVIVLVSLLGGGPKNYGVYVKDGEITLFMEGMKEPVELSSRLWKGKDAESRTFFGYRYSLENLVAVRDNGNLIIYPDKFAGNEGATLYMCNPNKSKEEPVKIDSGVSGFYLTEDGKTMLYRTAEKFGVYLYDLEKQEEIMKDKGVLSVFYSKDLSKLCYMTDDGKVYIWTAETDAVKVAKDASSIRYFPDADMLFVLTEDGELLRKTAEMEEAEEIAEDVSRIAAAYASGEVYFVRESEVERNLLDYFDDDMAADDAALTKPKKPTYPSAPKKPYYWNYDVYADYEEALAEYNVKYAQYQEEYNKLRTAYNDAVDAYNAKTERDEIRARLDRTVTKTEYSLSYFNGTDEVLISDSITSQYPGSYAADVPVMTYTAYVVKDVEKPKMSEAEDPWSVSNAVSANLWNALYGETQLTIALGADSTAVEHEDAAHVRVSSDGAAVFFMDAPFAAFEDGKYTTTSTSSAPVAEAPAYDAPAADAPADGEEEEAEEELIAFDQREYASLYKITIADGVVGAPELFDSDVSYVFTPSVGATAEDIFYFKEVDGDEKTGALYRNGVLLAEDVRASSYYLEGDMLMFYTDWDTEDSCGTLCALNLAEENAEVLEIGDDVTDYQLTDTGDILFLQDYDWDDYEGTLMLYGMKKGEAVEVDDDVTCLLIIR